MKRLVLLALVLATAGACGDNAPARPDAGEEVVDALPDAPPDGPVTPTTLTTYVIDLITNGTSNTAEPRPITEFADLPDPDGTTNNAAAYAPLFP